MRNADVSRVVSFPKLSDPGWGVTKVRLAIRGNYLLVVDNLFDLSHVAYVHNTTIGNAAVAEQAKVEFTRHGNIVRVTRDMHGVPATRTYAELVASGYSSIAGSCRSFIRRVIF